ncbi:hypothetical protein GCM10010361_08740 [Streptomyces olivaceiscleroticus]|uniref:Uncharacterized protein n=1 Tax=Streptomyces olivaceiscleroticus TaxID=68245 RepID=A0ABN0ZGM6_9ACTN
MAVRTIRRGSTGRPYEPYGEHAFARTNRTGGTRTRGNSLPWEDHGTGMDNRLPVGHRAGEDARRGEALLLTNKTRSKW